MSGRQDFTVRDAQAIHQDGLDLFSGPQSMNTHKLTDVVDPSDAQDAATKGWATTADAAVAAASLPLSGASAMTGALNMGSHKITNLTNGAAAQDAAALGQVGPMLFFFRTGSTGTTAVGTHYYPAPFTETTVGSTEIKIIMPACVVSKIILNCAVNNINNSAGSQFNASLNKNGTATAMTWTLANANGTTKQIITAGGPVTFNEGDYLSIQYDAAGGSWTTSNVIGLVHTIVAALF